MPALHNPHFIYGGDYNPDQWPEDVWLEDARLMREAGVNLVSLGIFSWTKLQPAEDKFDFDWLDRLMDLLHAHGVNVNLATPTASPPAWLVRGYPDVLPITDNETTLWHGARRHYCPHSPSYREHVGKIVTQLAKRYTSHPALAMWHVDNEYASGITECFCENSATVFRQWLQNKYGSLNKLNDAWGTAFWSQTYGEWEEIHPPRKAPASVNPSQRLDWARFNSDSWITLFIEQKAIFNQFTPKIPITTNFMVFHKPIDYWKFAAQEDIVSLDSYPDLFDPAWKIHAAMSCDLMRSIGNRCPWIITEQAPAHVNWRQRNSTKRPGVMRLISYQAIARGADGIMFFQWRASKAGSEKHHSAMVPHFGTDSRVWREVKALGNELSKLDSVLGSEVQADVAILLDWENWWALELPDKPSNDLRLMSQILSYYSSLYQRKITVDFAHPESALSRYKLVIAPNLYLVNDKAVDNINRYVEYGGNLIMSFFSGMVDENEQIRLGGYPAPFRDMLGLVVEEYVPYSATDSNTIRTTDGKQFQCTFWSDVIHLNGAELIAKFEQDYFAGNPAITRNAYGRGTSYYVGTFPDASGMDWLMTRVCDEFGIKPVHPNAPAEVELLHRTNGGSSFLFVLNHSAEKVSIQLDRQGLDLLTGAQVNATIELEPTGVAIIQTD